MSLIPIGTVLEFDVHVHDPSAENGPLADADSTPTFDVIQQGSRTPLLAAQAMTHESTGVYYGAFTVTASTPTFTPGKIVQVKSTAIVGGATDKLVVMRFRVGAAETTAGVPKVEVASIAANAITATSIAADAITDAKVASDVTIASVTGAVGSVTGNVGGNVAGSVGSVTGNVGGNVAGSVGSVTGAVGSVAGAVASVTGNVGGNVAGSVGSVAAGGITAASIATGAIDADALAADAATEIAEAVHEAIIEGTTSHRESMRLANAANAGIVSGAGTTEIRIRDLADTKDRIVSTVDTLGNRIAVTRDVS